jgi:hypothetical protein
MLISVTWVYIIYFYLFYSADLQHVHVTTCSNIEMFPIVFMHLIQSHCIVTVTVQYYGTAMNLISFHSHENCSTPQFTFLISVHITYSRNFFVFVGQRL